MRRRRGKAVNRGTQAGELECRGALANSLGTLSEAEYNLQAQR